MTRASSGGCATPSADRVTRLTALVPEALVDVAVAEACALTGVGCMQGESETGRVRLDIWIPETGSPGADVLQRHLERAGIAAEVSEAPEGMAWRNALRDFHQPVTAGRVRVRPPWVAPAPGMLDVVIDPGMAFGTGQHPTTRTALALLQELPPGEPVLDAGCGSGVLSIAACRLGMGPVTAIDHDPEAVAATVRGGRANMVPLDVHWATIGTDPLPAAPVLIANITLEVLGVLATALRGRPSPVAHAVLSGLREHEVDDAVAAFRPLGLIERRRLAEDGWASVRLTA
jgi:ribosomal protein L11 methyltransferase